MRLAKLLFSMPNAICIAGNHEYDFVKHYRALMAEAQDHDTVLDKLRNRFEDGRLLDWEKVDAIDSLPFYAEGQNFIGVHAGVPVVDGKALHPSKATCEQLVYDRRFKDEDVLPEESKCVLFGHTPVRYLTNRDEIVFYPRKGAKTDSPNIADYCKVHLDTGVYLSGVLGCVALDECRAIYVGPHMN